MYETFLLLIFMNIAAKVILSSLTLGFFAGTLARPTDGSVNRKKREHPFLLSLAEFRDVVNDLKVKKQFYLDVLTYTCAPNGYKTVAFLFVGDSKKNLLLASSDFPCLAEKTQEWNGVNYGKIAQRALFKLNTESPMAAMRKAITVLTHQKQMHFNQLFWLDIPGGINLPGTDFLNKHSNSILELVHRPVTAYESVEKKQSKERKKFYLHMRKFHQGLLERNDIPTLAVGLSRKLTRPLDKLTKIEKTVEELVNERVTWIAKNYKKDELEEFKIKGSKGLTLVFHDERNLVLFQKQGRKRILSQEGGRGWTAVGYQVQLPKMKNMGKIASIMVVPQRPNYDKPDWEGFWVQVLSKKGILWLPICKQNLQRVSKQLDREIREMG